MSDLTRPAPAAEPPQPQDKPKTLTQKLTQWFVAIALIISGGLGLMKLFNQFTLPSCTSDRTSDTLKSIFKGKNVEVSDISAMTSLTDTYSEKTCKAHVKAPNEEANIEYRIYWDGWSPTVMITKVN